MRKYVHKILAAALSVCLLISYNPAAGYADDAATNPNRGTVALSGAADANNGVLDMTGDIDRSDKQDAVDAGVTEGGTKDYDESSSGRASTSIDIGTFTDDIVTKSSDVIYASTQEITAERLTAKVAATGGQIKNSHTFTWWVYEDANSDPILGGTNGLSTASGNLTELRVEAQANDDRVYICSFDLNYYVGRNPGFSDGHLYTFKIQVTDGKDTVWADPIYLYTVPYDPDYDDYYGDWTKHSDLTGFQDGAAEADRIAAADEEQRSFNVNDFAVHSTQMFKGSTVHDSNLSAYNTIWTQMLAKAGWESSLAGDTDYMLNKVWDVEVVADPSEFSTGSNPTTAIRPFLTDTVDLYIPFDTRNLGLAGDNVQNYVNAYGDQIVVYWTDGASDERGNLDVKEFSGVIVIPEDGSQAYIKVEGFDVPDMSNPGNLGYFSPRYVGPHDYVHRYEVRTDVSTEHLDGSTTPNDGGYFFPGGLAYVGEAIGAFPNSVNFFPGGSGMSYGIQLGAGQKDEDGNPLTRFQLEDLQLEVNDAGQISRVDFVRDGFILPGVNNSMYSYNGVEGISSAAQTVAITSGKPNVIYTWHATFKEVSVDLEAIIGFSAEVLSEADFYNDPTRETSDEIGSLRLLYNETTEGNLAMYPEFGSNPPYVKKIGGEAEADQLKILNNGLGELDMYVANPQVYGVTGFRVSDGQRYEYNADSSLDGERKDPYTIYTSNQDLDGKLIYSDVTLEEASKYIVRSTAYKECHVQVCFGVTNTPQQTTHEVTIRSTGENGSGGLWDATAGVFEANPVTKEFTVNVPNQWAFKANPGYKLDSLTVTYKGMSQELTVPTPDTDGVYLYTFPNDINGDYEIVANFAVDTDQHRMQVVVQTTENGATTISEAGGTVYPTSYTVVGDTTCDFQVIPNRGYEIVGATVLKMDNTPFQVEDPNNPDTMIDKYAGLSIQNGSLRVVAPDADSKLVVTFKRNDVSQSELDNTKDKLYAVSASVKGNVGGSIVPNAATNVRAHDSYTMSFNPTQGYEVSSVTVYPMVNGTISDTGTRYPASGVLGSRTFMYPDVNQDLHFEVEFLPVGDGPGEIPEISPIPEYIDVVFSINMLGTGSGTMSPTYTNTRVLSVPKGSSIPFSFTADPGSIFRGATITLTPDSSTDTPRTITLGANDAPYALLAGLVKGTITVTVTFDKDDDAVTDDMRFTLTTQATGAGTVVTPQTLVGGTSATVTFKPNPADATSPEGYKLQDGSVTFDDSETSAYFNPTTATIRFAMKGGENDKAAMGEAAYTSGAALSSCIITASNGTRVELLQDGIITNHNHGLTLQNVRTDIVVAGTFTTASAGDSTGPDDEKLHRIDASVSGGVGTISPAGTFTVQDGSSQTFVFTPIAGYKIKDVTVESGNWLDNVWSNITNIFTGDQDAAKLTAINNGYYTIKDIHADYVVKVEFVRDTATSETPGAQTRPVTVLTDGNGTVSPDGVVLLDCAPTTGGTGGSQTYIVTPNPGYKVDSVRIEPQSSLNINFDNTDNTQFTVTLRDDGSTASVIRVTFVELAPGENPPAPVTPDAVVNIESGPNGVVSPVGDVQMVGDQKVWVVPAPGYEVDQIIADGDATRYVVDPAGGWFTIKDDGTVPSSIKVTFKPREFDELYYTITGVVVPGSDGQPHGTVTPATCKVPVDQWQTIFIQPDTGFKVKSITDSGGATLGLTNPSGTVNSWIITPVRGQDGHVVDREITVEFEPVAPNEDPNKYRAETVRIWSYKEGTGRSKGVVSPSDSYIDIEKGSNILMSFWVNDPLNNTFITGVKVNGEERMGLSESNPLIGGRGSFRIDSSYTHSDLDFGVVFNNVVDPDVNDPNDEGLLSVQVSGSGIGSVTLRGIENATVSNANTNNSKVPGMGAAYGQNTKTEEITLPDATVPVDVQIVPENGSQIAKILMTDNCKVINYTPDTYQANTNLSQTLDYRIMVVNPDDNPSQSARIYVEFSPLSKESYFDADDVTGGGYVPNESSYSTDVRLSANIEGNGSITELVGENGNATDLFELRDPNNARQQGNDGETISYAIPADAENLTFEVGPLVKIDPDKPTLASSTLYTLESVSIDGVQLDGSKIKGMINRNPFGGLSALSDAIEEGTTIASFDAAGNLQQEDLTPAAMGRLAADVTAPRYYQYYTFETDSLEPATSDEPRQVVITLRKLSNDEGADGNFFVRNDESNTYTITTRVATGDETGTLGIWPVGPEVQRGSNVTVNWEPAEGYALESLTVGGTNVTGAAIDAGSGNYIVTADSNKEIVASFVPEDQLQSFYIDVTVRGNGTVSGGGANIRADNGTTRVPVTVNRNIIFTLTPDEGYSPYRVTYDGTTSIWPIRTFPISNVDANHTLVVEFATQDVVDGAVNGNGTNGTGNGNTTQTGQGTGNGAGTFLSQTGDKIWLMVGILLVVVAAVCVFMAMRMRRLSATAAQEAAYERARQGYGNDPNLRR